MDWAAFADFAVKAGVPTALGCVIVWYLLWKHIPQLMNTHKVFMDDLVKINDEQRKECKSSIETMSKEHKEAVQAIADDHKKAVEALRTEITSQTSALRDHLLADSKIQLAHRADEGARTREALSELSKETRKLAEAIYRQQGLESLPDNIRPLRTKDKEKA